MPKKGERYTVRIIDLTDEGAGIGKVDGFPLFVKDTVIGDECEVEVIKDKKTYGYARLLEVVTPSADRIEAECEVARPCGGCTLQMMDYAAQLRWKEEKVASQLERIGGQKNKAQDTDGYEMLPIVGMESPWRYRNKAEYPVRLSKDGEIVMGFYAGRTHSIITCKDCKIGGAGDRKILDAIKAWMLDCGITAYNEETGKGLLRHIMIRTSRAYGDVMVCLVINGRKLPHADELIASLPKGCEISYSINTSRNNVIMGRELKKVSGRGYIEDKIGDITFRISPLAFYQVNPTQTEKLYQASLDFAGLGGDENVWDLYCGIGTISLFLAQKAGKVRGVEIVPEAIEDAKANAALNKITNAEFFVGAAEDVLPEHFSKTGEKADVIVVDPPRKGCVERLLDTIKEMSPKRIVYVSCNPATLARDVKILCEGRGGEASYRLEKVQPVDMFPQTGHVETVVLMTLHFVGTIIQ